MCSANPVVFGHYAYILPRRAWGLANNVVGNDKDNKPVRSSLKLLGIMVQEDLRWGQVALMTKRASRKIWVMRRVKMKMKNVGLDGKNYLRFFF